MTHTGPYFSEGEVIERIESFRRRRPRLKDEIITLAHGAGGKSSAALVDAVFVEAFGNDKLGDGAVFTVPGGRVAMSTDSFVVQPLRFPGGSIGHLAVHGTVNDLAMAGAVPRWLSAAFVLEEGFAIAELRAIVADMAAAAEAAGVRIVTGDTKVVPRGAADGLFITTAGVGVHPGQPGLHAPAARRPGAALGHDGRPRHGRDARPRRPRHRGRHLLRHRRGQRDGRGALGRRPLDCAGCATPPAAASAPSATSSPRPRVSPWCSTRSPCPSRRPSTAPARCSASTRSTSPTRARSLAVVAPDEAAAALAALRAHPLGADAVDIGEVGAEPAATVVLRTAFGGTRIVDMLVGDPLPRIC